MKEKKKRIRPVPLTLIFKQHDLHPIQREGLSEAVRHRVLLLLENLGYLE